jgi:hypothetical protein
MEESITEAYHSQLEKLTLNILKLSNLSKISAESLGCKKEMATIV